jgi:hypothetical protein
VNAAPGEHVYVYYRQRGERAAAHAAVAALFADLEAETGVAGRLLERADGSGTWLEVYEPVADSGRFLRDLATGVARHRVERYAVDGRRVIERFVAATSGPAAAAR